MFVFFIDTPTTELYTLSLTTLFRSASTSRAAAPCAVVVTFRCASGSHACESAPCCDTIRCGPNDAASSGTSDATARSEEHTSELQSQSNLVCRLLLEKKNTSAVTTH